MKCFGRNISKDSNHCCWINGVECPFLERGTEKGQLYSCQLRREGGSWAAAIADRRYTETPESPGNVFAKFGYDCETFQCPECGMLERGEIGQAEFVRMKAA